MTAAPILCISAHSGIKLSCNAENCLLGSFFLHTISPLNPVPSFCSILPQVKDPRGRRRLTQKILSKMSRGLSMALLPSLLPKFSLSLFKLKQRQPDLPRSEPQGGTGVVFPPPKKRDEEENCLLCCF